MAKLTKRLVDAAESQEKGYVIWDDELPGFGLRVFTPGKRRNSNRPHTRSIAIRERPRLHGSYKRPPARRLQLRKVSGLPPSVAPQRL
jgi:hypothetical protein